VSAQGAPESKLTHVRGEARVPQFPGILVALLTAAMIFIYLHCFYIVFASSSASSCRLYLANSYADDAPVRLDLD
jgi:hypothetical protein